MDHFPVIFFVLLACPHNDAFAGEMRGETAAASQNYANASSKDEFDAPNRSTNLIRDDNIVYVDSFPQVEGRDATSAVQAALDATPNKVLYFGPKTYIVGPLFIRKNSHIILSSKTIILARPGFQKNESLINISNVNDVLIEGNGGTIKMQKSEYTLGEQRHGVIILSSSNIIVKEINSIDSGGDGFYIGSKDNISPSVDIKLIGCSAINNKRQGLSIVSARNLIVNGGIYSMTKGTAPEFGIDIEPNSSNDWLENIAIKNVKTSGNARGGIQFALLMFGSTKSNDVSIMIENWHSEGDGLAGALRFAGGPQNRLHGAISIINARIDNPVGRGIDFSSINYFMPKISVTDTTIRNPGYSMKNPGNMDRSAVVFASTKGIESTVDNIFFENCEFLGDEIGRKLYTGFYFSENIHINMISLKKLAIDNAATREFTVLGSGGNNIYETRIEE